MYGNGGPGLKEAARDHERRLAGVEALNVPDVSVKLEAIEKRHAGEDEKAKDRDGELRKLWYGIIAAVAVDIITRFFF